MKAHRDFSKNRAVVYYLTIVNKKNLAIFPNRNKIVIADGMVNSLSVECVLDMRKISLLFIVDYIHAA